MSDIYVFNGGPEDDDVRGMAGMINHLAGNGGNDTLRGRGKDDLLLGGAGEDDLFGANGDDTLFGGQGDDNLNGGNGADVLSGDKGSDTLTGGNGNDTFVFNANTFMEGDVDTVTDFEGGAGSSFQDIVQFTNADENLVTVNQNGGNVEVSYDGVVVAVFESAVAADVEAALVF